MPPATGLHVADQLGVRTVAFPAIATGVYGFPAAQAARIAVDTTRSTPTAVAAIRLVAFDETTLDFLTVAMQDATVPQTDTSTG